jgi:alanyl-tRNA synthetase
MDKTKIKEIFITYFKENGHKYIPSSNIIPDNDPTLLFTNAGMNQFKSIFLNENIPDKFKNLKRACNYQKCIRAGGKHNDLDDVGKDVYHHTFFEMLGTWSFNDYGKEKAIDMAWDLLINYYKINSDNVYVTYYEGDEKLNIKPDLDTFNFWKKYIPENRIVKGNTKDNFWSMGTLGPCGPCTEIHYDRIGNRNASNLVNQDDPDVLEIWNIVSIEYNMLENGNLIKLDSKFIDTGMGFERLVSILQNKTSNYDTDIFIPIIKIIQKQIGCDEYTGIIKYDINQKDMAYRVLSDHLRTIIIAINDGCIPGSNGRDYIIRKIIRRAIFYGDKLGGKALFLTEISKLVIELFSDFYDLNFDKIITIIKNEETLFEKTLKNGKKILKKYIKNIRKENNTLLSGDLVFKLCTGAGLPIDIIEIICEEQNIRIDIDLYNKLLKEHKNI